MTRHSEDASTSFHFLRTSVTGRSKILSSKKRSLQKRRALSPS